MSAGALSQAGPALLFMLLLAASIIVGVCVLAFAARCVLAVLQDTASGQDEIVWPDEPYVDWLGYAIQFLELLGIWLVPSALAARLLREVWLPENGALRVLLLAGPGLWLFFPIGLLSSLSALSRWTPFRWAIAMRFLRVAPAALVFYFFTAILLCAAVVPWYYALFRGRGYLLPVAAGIAAFVLFVYARLLGRLAFMIQRLPTTERTAAQAEAKKANPSHSKKKRKPRTDVQDPWAIPEEEERKNKSKKRFPWAEEPPSEKPDYHVPSAEDIEGYGIAANKPNAPEPPPEQPPRSRFAMSPEKYESVEVQGESEPQSPPETQSELFEQQVRQHMAERIHVRHKLPPYPFINGVYTFPFYRACFPYAFALSLAFLVVGVLVYQMMKFGRDLFGW